VDSEDRGDAPLPDGLATLAGMRTTLLGVLVSLGLIALPAGASAQSLPSDPEAGSPSGAIYEIPVERARKDAAPRGGGSQPQQDTTGSGVAPDSGSGSPPASGEASGASDGETSIRSENNFGTSSRVPGAGDGRAEGSGGAAEGDGDGEPAGAFSSVTTGATEGPSDSVVFLLLAAVLGVGGLVGVVAGRRAARHQT
jgi:hypothetical protein